MVEFQNVTKRYGAHVALDSVSTVFPNGEIIGLLGQNGAGKTTMLRLISGIFKPDAGCILFNNEPISLSFPSKIGYLPEERGLYRKMTVIDLLLYLGQLKGLKAVEAKYRSYQWLSKLELVDWANQEVGALSKGMQQKIQFISSVLHEPMLLILDEPFSGFDPINAELLKQEIISLHQNGVTIILSTHRMESAQDLCTHLIMLNRSKIVLDGNKQMILSSYNHNCVSLRTESKINFTPLTFEIVSYDNLRYQVKLINNHTKNELLSELIANSIQVVAINDMVYSLNDIFISKI